MHAPVGKQWNLATIHSLGGWAEGEHVGLGLSLLLPLHRLTGMQKRDTLIRYLLDEPYYYEEGHGDALRPIPKCADKSFLGEHAENRPVTKNEVQTIIHAQVEAATHKLIETFHSAGAGQARTATGLC